MYVSMLCTLTGFVSEVMHRRIRTDYVAMKYSCRSTQNSVEGRAQTAPRQMRKKIPQGITARQNKRGSE